MVKNSEIFAGFCIPEPLEKISTVRGLDNGTSLSVGWTVDVADTCVSRLFHDRGIGRKLKRTQIEQARTLGYPMIVG